MQSLKVSRVDILRGFKAIIETAVTLPDTAAKLKVLHYILEGLHREIEGFDELLMLSDERIGDLIVVLKELLQILESFYKEVSSHNAFTGVAKEIAQLGAMVIIAMRAGSLGKLELFDCTQELLLASMGCRKTGTFQKIINALPRAKSRFIEHGLQESMRGYFQALLTDLEHYHTEHGVGTPAELAEIKAFMHNENN